jgi:hypothetical protein
MMHLMASQSRIPFNGRLTDAQAGRMHLEILDLLLLLFSLHHGEYLLASQLRIPFHGRLIDARVGRMYLEIIDLLSLLFHEYTTYWWLS